MCELYAFLKDMFWAHIQYTATLDISVRYRYSGYYYYDFEYKAYMYNFELLLYDDEQLLDYRTYPLELL